MHWHTGSRPTQVTPRDRTPWNAPGRLLWAIEGSNGAGRPLAQRLLEAGEHVVDVPAKLAARVRLFEAAPDPRRHCGIRRGAARARTARPGRPRLAAAERRNTGEDPLPGLPSDWAQWGFRRRDRRGRARSSACSPVATRSVRSRPKRSLPRRPGPAWAEVAVHEHRRCCLYRRPGPHRPRLRLHRLCRVHTLTGRSTTDRACAPRPDPARECQGGDVGLTSESRRY